MAEKTVPIMENLLSENERIAESVRKSLTEKRILSINMMGAPGSGKTSVLKEVIKKLCIPSAVIEGDVESDIDTVDLQKNGISAFQINTMGGCHLDAPMIKTALAGFNIKDSSFLFIENIGNLICPAEFDIGEHLRLIICSVADGSDKPYKYPLAFERADAVVLNKDDLIPYVNFDKEFFIEGVKKLNMKTRLFFASCKEHTGFEAIASWLAAERKRIYPFLD
jgi:hydrogenase nickel incorporation protein HypB